MMTDTEQQLQQLSETLIQVVATLLAMQGLLEKVASMVADRLTDAEHEYLSSETQKLMAIVQTITTPVLGHG
jgi:hypothetical protein